MAALHLVACGGDILASDDDEIFAPLCADLTTKAYDVTLHLAVPEGIDAHTLQADLVIHSGEATFDVATRDGERLGNAELSRDSDEANYRLSVALPLRSYEVGEGSYEAHLVVTASGDVPTIFEIYGSVAYPKSGCGGGPAPELTLEVSPGEHENDTADTATL